MAAPRVTVVIPSWNGAQWLPGCLWAVSQQTWPNMEVIVVDNGSADASAMAFQAASSGRSGWKWVALADNAGFGVAVNHGIAAATGEWIALLNNDAAPMPGWVETAMRSVKDGRTGMVTCKILRMRQPDRLDKVGHLMFPDGLNRGLGTGELDDGQYDALAESLFPDGAAGLYRKSMLDEIGGFDPHLFAYGDDSELGMRARWRGWQCVPSPRSVVYHWHSATAGAYTPWKARLVERNRIWLKWKLMPWPYLIIAPFFTLARYAFQGWGALAGRGAAGQSRNQHGALALAWALVMAHVSALAGLPRVLRERRLVIRGRRIGIWAMTRLLWRHRIGAARLALED